MATEEKKGAREEAERFRLIVESVKDYAIFMLDPSGHVRTWNLGAQRIKGYLASEIIGQHFSIFYPKEEKTLARCQDELDVATRDGRFEEEGWRIRKDGTRFWANVVITALRDSSGELVGFAKVTRDLTERRNAEEEARRFRLLVESVKDYAIFILDDHGRVMTWNPGAHRINGYQASEAIGRHFSIFYPPSDVAAGKCEFELDVAKREGRFEEEGWRLRKDSTRFWASVTITALRNADGNLVGFAKVTRDLTERREAEEQRIKLAKAEEAERRNHEFLAIMGHELRNPLAPMLTALQLMRLRGGRNCEREMDVLERQLTHMRRLVDDLMDASRFERDEVRLSTRVMEIGDVLANAVDMAGPLVQTKRHRLEIHVPKNGLLVDVDPGRMTQVFGNLLNNAAKYTDEGGVLTISAAAEKEHVVVRVEDNGIGIPAELMPRIFDLFTQAQQGIDRREGGLGIGLCVAKKLVQKHRGEIYAENRATGKGSVFTVRIPRVDREPASDTKSAPPERISTTPAHRILVVDDNRDGADMLALCLEEMGHDVRTAFDGVSALSEAEAHSPELIFLDVGLPKLDGYQVVARMRTIPALASVPIVAVTGYASESDRNRAIQAGFTSHIAKPLDIERLGGLVHDLLKLVPGG